MRKPSDPYFLGKVVRVILFGSTLKPEVQRLSDVDIAVELAPKAAGRERAHERNYQRAEELAEKEGGFETPLKWH